MWKYPKCKTSVSGGICPDCGEKKPNDTVRALKKDLKEQAQKEKLLIKISKLETKRQKKMEELKMQYASVGVDGGNISENHKLKTEKRALISICFFMLIIIVLSTGVFAMFTYEKEKKQREKINEIALLEDEIRYYRDCAESISKSGKRSLMMTNEKSVNATGNVNATGFGQSVELKSDGTVVATGANEH